MNEQVGNTTVPIFNGAPAWLTLPFALIALGVVFALLILIVGSRLAARRRAAREEVEEYNEEYAETPEPARTVAAPSVAAEPEPLIERSPAPAVVEETPAPEPLADEPIVAAGPMDASPASLASDIAEPAPAPAVSTPSAPDLDPDVSVPSAPPADDLTRMKGVGPRLAERLNTVGVTSFAQLAALTPEEAEALDARLGDFQGRIYRDRWIEQAGYLAQDDIAGFEGTFGKL
jgi:predicted flap endonuclease-1-like 5' DNA nuclease